MTPITTPKKRRPLSMPDVLGQTGLRRRATVTATPTRLLDFPRRGRSPSPTKSKAWKPLVAPFSPPQIADSSEKATVEEIELSPVSILSLQPDPFTLFVDAEKATPKNPISNFRGGVAWDDLPRNKKALELDLYWPYESDAETMECLHLVELEPLCHFLGLRSLKLVGMMQSYQTYIWKAAWLNLNLDELELGMALEPEIISSQRAGHWKLIEEGWEMDKKISGPPVYQ